MTPETQAVSLFLEKANQKEREEGGRKDRRERNKRESKKKRERIEAGRKNRRGVECGH